LRRAGTVREQKSPPALSRRQPGLKLALRKARREVICRLAVPRGCGIVVSVIRGPVVAA
jgi:hypothetical protein